MVLILLSCHDRVRPGRHAAAQIAETIVSLNTDLEVAIRYSQPRLTATAVAERQRPSLPEPSDLDLGKECHQPPAGNTFGLRRCMLVKGEEEKQQQKVG